MINTCEPNSSNKKSLSGQHGLDWNMPDCCEDYNLMQGPNVLHVVFDDRRDAMKYISVKEADARNTMVSNS